MPDHQAEPEHGLREAIYWSTLKLRLPSEGVRKRFGSEEVCRARLAQTRWPDGPVCPACGSDDVLRLSTRAVLKCRACMHQFSVTSGTHLHGSRLELLMWFAATEKTIHSRSIDLRDSHIPANELATLLGVHYVAARRARKIILEDLAGDGPGLLRECVCVNDIVLPTDIVPDSDRHFEWLFDELQGTSTEDW